MPTADHELDLGALGGAVVRVRDRTIEAAAELLPGALEVPAGRYRVKVALTSTPPDHSGPPALGQAEVDLAAPGPLPLPAGLVHHAHKAMDGQAVALHAGLVVDRWDGAGWVRHATRALRVPGTPIAPRRVQRLGANVHTLGAMETAPRLMRLLDAAADLGLDIVRCSAPWGFLEQAGKGQFDGPTVAQVDAFMDGIAARGLTALVILGGGCPTWAGPAGAPVINYRWPHPTTGPLYRFVGGGFAPVDWSDYADYVAWFVNRYYDRGLVAVEAPNEPNAPSWDLNPDATRAAWSNTLGVGVAASDHPDVIAIAGVTSWCDAPFLERMYAAGLDFAANNVGAWSVHPYPLTFDEEETGFADLSWDARRPMPHAAPWWHSHAGVDEIADVLDAHGDADVPVWVTEVGFSSSHHPQSYGDHLQGAMLRYSLLHLAHATRVDAVIFHTLEEVAHDGRGYARDPYDWHARFGILRTDRVTRKPAYDVVKATIAELRAG